MRCQSLASLFSPFRLCTEQCPTSMRIRPTTLRSQSWHSCWSLTTCFGDNHHKLVRSHFSPLLGADENLQCLLLPPASLCSYSKSLKCLSATSLLSTLNQLTSFFICKKLPKKGIGLGPLIPHLLRSWKVRNGAYR